MPRTTSLKAAGKVATPPAQADFDKIPLLDYCRIETGLFRRLHVLKPRTKKPWPAVYFSTAGITRFDPVGGAGTMCVGQSLGGAMMEKFDDSWGPRGDSSRKVTETQLKETWETVISLPSVTLFDCSGPNHLSFIGTDAQMYTGEYSGTQVWALRMMRHPALIDGIWFPSRHDPNRHNIALFQRTAFTSSSYDPSLTVINIGTWTAALAHAAGLIYGPAQDLATHSDTDDTLTELRVGRVP
jgi:hypothetical protein